MSIRVASLIALLSVAFAGGSQNSSSPSAQDQPKPLRVRVSSGVAEGLLVKKVNPDYPKDARKQGIQGTVALSVRISTKGNVIDATLISGHPALAQAAIDAVKQWKYRPFLLNGQPAEVETRVLVNFTLAGS